MKDSCFSGDYDILAKNTAFQKVREAENSRLSNQVAQLRHKDEQEYNKECRMEQKTHIMQMEANAKEKAPSVPLVRLVKD